MIVKIFVCKYKGHSMPTQTMPPRVTTSDFVEKIPEETTCCQQRNFKISAFNSKQFQRYDTLKFVGHAHFCFLIVPNAHFTCM